MQFEIHFDILTGFSKFGPTLRPRLPQSPSCRKNYERLLVMSIFCLTVNPVALFTSEMIFIKKSAPTRAEIRTLDRTVYNTGLQSIEPTRTFLYYIPLYLFGFLDRFSPVQREFQAPKKMVP